MSHTEGAHSSIETLITRYATLSAKVTMTQKELEDQIHIEVWRGDWDEVRRLLDLLPGTPSREAARDCITRAIHTAPTDLIAYLLERLPREEYTEIEAYEVDWSPTGEVYRRHKWDVCVQGTLVMHAVANNRPDVLQMLLEHGYDVNCASVSAAAGLLRAFGEHVVSYGRDFNPFHACIARPENCVKLRRWDADPDEIQPMVWDGATPLALAVLMGHAECARILVDHGTWMEEAPSVSSAMYLFWRAKDADYQAARAAVLEHGELADHRPLLWAVGQTCSPGQLKTVLEVYPYSKEDLTEAACEMLKAFRYQRDLWKEYDQGWRTLCLKLCRIGKCCPEALCEPETLGALLTQCCNMQDCQLEPFLPFWKGRQLDLSCIETGFYWLTRPEGQQMLETLAQHCDLVMDRDAVSPGTHVQVLRLLLKHVTFLPPASKQGISGLTIALLVNGSLRLVRDALKRGVIPPEESTADLLLCQKHFPVSPVCRSAILTTPRPAAKRGEGEQRLCLQHPNRWFSQSLSKHTQPILTDSDWARWLYPTLRSPYGRWSVKLAGGEWEISHTFFAACMEGRSDIVEEWLRQAPWQELRDTDSLVDPERQIHVVVTPLCAAAMAGQREVVELLLECGAPLQEDLWGSPSVWTDHWGMEEEETSLPFNPVLAAALGGNWDIVKDLLTRGAVCDWNAPETQTIWSRFHEEDLARVVREELGGQNGICE